MKRIKGYTCIFSQLAPVRSGKPRAFNQDNFGCGDAAGILGFGKAWTMAKFDALGLMPLIPRRR